MLSTPVLHGVPVPLAWHMTPEEVRHRLGSPRTIKPAPADAPPVRAEPSHLRPETTARVGGGRRSIRLPEPVKVDTKQATEDRQKIFAALREQPEGRNRAALVRTTGLYLQRVIDLTREDEERGNLIRVLQGPGKPILLKPAPIAKAERA